MALTDDVVKDLKARIDRTLEDLKKELSKIRTGRASLSVLEGVRVNYYGTPTPLTGVASLAVPEPRLITIKPWEKGLIKEIEKALGEANLGLTPMNDGELIRLPDSPSHRGAAQGHRQAGAHQGRGPPGGRPHRAAGRQ